MKHTFTIWIVFLWFVNTISLQAADLWIEAESFNHKGGWVVDQQFMDQMGSPYLLAHGIGNPVEDAYTELYIPQQGEYWVYVRTYNWTSPWKEGEGIGKFRLCINKKSLPAQLGNQGKKWGWQLAGRIKLKQQKVEIRLKDLSGFDGRCDAIYLTTDPSSLPADDGKELDRFRRNILKLDDIAPSAGNFDFVVIGAGVAGMSAAATAARLGYKVALIGDRPVLGGNNSSEIRVGLGGRIAVGAYKELGGLQKEFGPSRGGNGKPAGQYEDDKKMEWMKNQSGVTLFLSQHVNRVEVKDNKIISVTAAHIETGKELRFEAPLFADCTGDGNVGYLAGADYRMGREGQDEFGESIAPQVADKQTMGVSILWTSEDCGKKTSFPDLQYGVNFTPESCERVNHGEWQWETGMNRHQVDDAERVRDYGMLVVYANWSFLKNKLSDNAQWHNRRLSWVAYVAGKRESRRLMGDYILKEDDLIKRVFHEDASFATSWTIDLHFPDRQNHQYFPNEEFKAETTHHTIHCYSVPYRCLYSRNINNLFMAGRNISVTHVALGTVRVMRTTGMMGEVVGMAAAICRQHDVLPRSVYQHFLPQLKQLMQKGIGDPSFPNNQTYSEGGSLDFRNKAD